MKVYSVKIGAFARVFCAMTLAVLLASTQMLSHVRAHENPPISALAVDQPTAVLTEGNLVVSWTAETYPDAVKICAALADAAADDNLACATDIGAGQLVVMEDDEDNGQKVLLAGDVVLLRVIDGEEKITVSEIKVTAGVVILPQPKPLPPSESEVDKDGLNEPDPWAQYSPPPQVPAVPEPIPVSPLANSALRMIARRARVAVATPVAAPSETTGEVQALVTAAPPVSSDVIPTQPPAIASDDGLGTNTLRVFTYLLPGVAVAAMAYVLWHLKNLAAAK